MAGPTPFTATASAVLNAAGAGQAVVGPAGVDWIVRTTTVSTSTAVNQSTATTYHGSVSQANIVDATQTGSGDTSDTQVLLQPGEQLYAVWTGGDAGAQAFVRVSGLSYPAGQGAANM